MNQVHNKQGHTGRMSLKSPLSLSTPHDISSFPRELHLNILTFLRATDLSALQRVSRCFNNRDLIADVVDHCANVVVSFLEELRSCLIWGCWVLACWCCNLHETSDSSRVGTFALDWHRL